MQKIAIIIVMLMVSKMGQAKKMIKSIELVILEADIIIIGEITEVGDKTYNLKVLENIKGASDTVITIQQFAEWTCDARFAKASKGQKLFLFLIKDENKLEIINGSTGEIPIINEQVTLKNEEYIHKDYEFTPYTLSFSEFKDGVKGYIKCFELTGPFISQKCSDEELSQFVQKSKFSQWLYQKAEKRKKTF